MHEPTPPSRRFGAYMLIASYQQLWERRQRLLVRYLAVC
jgi:hypothetical protein